MMSRTAAWALLILFAINAMNFFDRQILVQWLSPLEKNSNSMTSKLGNSAPPSLFYTRWWGCLWVGWRTE